MIHGNFKRKGLGKELYNLFEKYLSEKQCSFIRIDVVYNYNENVVGFWQKQGYSIQKEEFINWKGIESSAYLMMKKL